MPPRDGSNGKSSSCDAHMALTPKVECASAQHDLLHGRYWPCGQCALVDAGRRRLHTLSSSSQSFSSLLRPTHLPHNMATTDDKVENAAKIEHADDSSDNLEKAVHEEYGQNSDGDLPIYNDKETTRILRKVDYRLVPMLTLLYLLAFLV